MCVCVCATEECKWQVGQLWILRLARSGLLSPRNRPISSRGTTRVIFLPPRQASAGPRYVFLPRSVPCFCRIVFICDKVAENERRDRGTFFCDEMIDRVSNN